LKGFVSFFSGNHVGSLLSAQRRSREGDSMRELLTPEGYQQTKEKLADLERRLEEIDKRTDLNSDHLASVRRSYKMMMREYLEDIKLYEAKQGMQFSEG
jgi:ligand-binding sensor protein